MPNMQGWSCRNDRREHIVHDTTTDLDPLDRIDRSIDIDSTAERVWDLIARPGWWINEGTIDPEPEHEDDGGDVVVTHPVHGEFRLRTVESRPTSYLSYRWVDRDETVPEETSTLVEFWIEPRPSGVTLRVAESGFSRLGKARADWLRHRESNVEGWETELAAARTWVERPAAES
jgi:hypothetical protein